MLGEFAYLDDEIELDDVSGHLCDLMERTYTNRDTKIWVFSAISKLVAQTGGCSDQVLLMTNAHSKY